MNKKRKKRALNLNGLPNQLKELVESGVYLTVLEAAEHFKKSEWMVRTALNSLHGNNIWWIGIAGYQAGIGTNSIPGKIVDLRVTGYADDRERAERDRLSRFQMWCRKLEGAWLTFPEKRLEIEEALINMQHKFLSERSQLLKLESKENGN